MQLIERSAVGANRYESYGLHLQATLHNAREFEEEVADTIDHVEVLATRTMRDFERHLYAFTDQPPLEDDERLGVVAAHAGALVRELQRELYKPELLDRFFEVANIALTGLIERATANNAFHDTNLYATMQEAFTPNSNQQMTK